MITKVEGVEVFEKLFNCNPSPKGFEEVSEKEYEHYINDCIRVYSGMSHTGGKVIYDRNGKTVAFRTKGPKYYIVKEK